MAIALKNKVEAPKNDSFEKSARLTVEGTYECEILNARYQAKDDLYGDRYFLDLKVISGPELVGRLAYWAKFKNARYSNAKYKDAKGTERNFTAKQQEDRDEEYIQVCFAAALGLSQGDAGQLAPGGTHEGEFEKCFDEGDASSVIGKRVVITVRKNKNGYPEMKVAPVGATAAKAAPPKPASSQTRKPIAGFRDAYVAAGFAHRDDAPGWYWNETTEEQLDEADLKAKLGF
jgi:hypothetical protein